MKTLISKTLTHASSVQFSPPIFLFHFPSLSRKHPDFPNFSNRKRLCSPKTLTSYSTTAPGSPSYGGWDDLRFGGDSVHSGEPNQLRNFLNSLGIDDKKCIFMYLLGFVCALAITRVRVSSIVVFPACVIIFAVGFSIGFVNGGHVNELSLTGTKKRPKDENFKVSIEKLGSLMDLFNGFDVKIVNLKNDIKRGIKCNLITVGDLESYVKGLESIGLSALNARNIVEGCIDSIVFENQEVEGTLIGSKPNKMKDVFKRESVDMEGNNCSKENILASKVEEMISNSLSNSKVRNGNAGFSGDSSNNPAMIRDRAEELVNGARRVKVIAENEKMNLAEMDSNAKRVLDSEEYSYRNNGLRFMNNQRISLKMDHHYEVETWAFHDGLLDSVDFRVGLRHMKTEASFGQAQTCKRLNENYRHSDSMEKIGKETYRSSIREERVSPVDDPLLANHESPHQSDNGSSSSSMASDDMMFDRYLTEANILLKEARECLKHRGNEGRAESALYTSARLLSKAIDMKPMSLLAVGQLGNTYLLHGELKLEISRELRTVIARGDPLLVEKWGQVLKGLHDQVMSKDKIVSLLIDVCEECEELLVKAGRKYREALSIDGNDMRALYNWGLALSFRAQLIADIGPEAALDADKVFLAAIDKFDAMMSKSNVYAPNALFRWGAALQQRSRLRPRNSKEKVKLLQQARRLYEDALHVDSDNLQVREALSSCISELNHRN